MHVSFNAAAIECDGCAASISKALAGSAGVESVAVDVAAKTIEIEFDPARTDPASLAAELDEIGFPAQAMGA